MRRKSRSLAGTRVCSWRRVAFPAALAVLLLGISGAPARGVILPAVTLDGPSEDIVGFGGVAMAEDGTGGLVYLKRVEGVPHVFVSRFLGGKWLAPIRVDYEQPFAGSWPQVTTSTLGMKVRRVTWSASISPVASS